MIESIKIRNMGVIQEATLNLGAGFTALTGETGAGKTMVLTALNLLLGGRSDSSTIRRGESALFVEGLWQITDGDLTDRISGTGAEIEQGSLIVNRSVSLDGRSRAALGGASVPAATLAEFAEDLVAVHGQSDQIRLRSLTAQRHSLDAFGGAEVSLALEVYQRNYLAYRDLETRLERVRNAGEKDLQRTVFLRSLLAEIDDLKPQQNEIEELLEKINRLSNVEGLRSSAAMAHDAFSSEDSLDAMQLVAVARKAIESSQDPVLVDLAARIREISTLSAEVSADLASFIASLEADPKQLEQMLSRRAELIAFERKYGKSIQELISEQPGYQAELLDLDSSDDQVERLEMQLEAALSQLSLSAGQLSAARKAAASELKERVSQELAQLAMAGATLEISITTLADFESHGNDKIEFLLAAHPGAEPRPLGKGASGGELSRIMLAIELVLASSQLLPTMVFDEVDAGVGGQAAIQLGKRLKKLAESTQVIVVTHLPQVAAFADRQIRVSKEVSGEITSSSVSVLSDQEREIELARMLSGNPDSVVARQHARELLETR
ncbi:MAG: DNA repair protein RecN [Aquiluna sp.]|nr:DNA repair protein RecN [Aquiluna sp.]MCF8544925.1 DNA repair protein RecN [Aquiluna sp.]